MRSCSYISLVSDHAALSSGLQKTMRSKFIPIVSFPYQSMSKGSFHPDFKNPGSPSSLSKSSRSINSCCNAAGSHTRFLECPIRRVSKIAQSETVNSSSITVISTWSYSRKELTPLKFSIFLIVYISYQIS